VSEKRVQCDICEDWYPPESTRMLPRMVGEPPRPSGLVYRRCIDCAQSVLATTDRELQRLIALWEA
jgi:hypothetical protein